MDPTNTILNLISLKPNSASHLHCPQPPKTVCRHSPSCSPLSLLFWLGGEVNIAALGWLCREKGGGTEYWLMLICFASMLWCVSIGSRGPGISRIRAWITFVVWIESSSCCSHCCWHDATAAVDTRPSFGPPMLSSLIICQLLTLTRLRINQRWQTTVTTSQRGHCC